MDFSAKETSPEDLRDFYRALKQDRKRHPQTHIEAVVHIGEDFFDLSLESAVRWCHQSALYGATRLGHCIALGLSPEVAVSREDGAHMGETVRERQRQIEYDLLYADGLTSFGVEVDSVALLQQKQNLQERDPDSLVYRGYGKNRLQEVSRRQDYVLSDLARLGTVIETCPTSNLCIGGVPGLDSQPFRRLFDSEVNLAVCTDDPGIFNTSLSQEVDNVLHWFDLAPQQAAGRLGDPWEYRLGRDRRPIRPADRRNAAPPKESHSSDCS